MADLGGEVTFHRDAYQAVDKVTGVVEAPAWAMAVQPSHTQLGPVLKSKNRHRAATRSPYKQSVVAAESIKDKIDLSVGSVTTYTWALTDGDVLMAPSSTVVKYETEYAKGESIGPYVPLLDLVAINAEASPELNGPSIAPTYEAN